MCGQGSAARVRVERDLTPGPITELQVREENCAAVISWEKPEDRGRNPITEYRIEVREDAYQKTEVWHPLDQCNIDNCTIPMSRFEGLGTLRKGSPLHFRGYARNSVGYSLPSPLNTAIRVKGTPEPL